MNRRLSFFTGRFPAMRVAAFCCALLLVRAPQATAAQEAFRYYGGEQGLGSTAELCVRQGQAGFMLVCSEQGLYQYDGRKFAELGPAQGLRAGGIVLGLALTATGRLALYYANGMFISDRAADALHPWTTIPFSPLPMPHPGLDVSTQRTHRLATWRNGLVLAVESALWNVVVPAAGPAHLEPMNYSVQQETLLRDPTGVFSINGRLWAAMEDGRLCSADPADVRCYGTKDGLGHGPWVDMAEGPGGTVLARSVGTVATFDPVHGTWADIELPDQDAGRYINFRRSIGLFHTPDGRIATQSDHGLLIQDGADWRPLPGTSWMPETTITDAMTDEHGNFWLSSEGQGVIRWVGYGQWQTLNSSDGLSAGLPWQTARSADGHVWVATDTGIDEIGGEASDRPRVLRTVPGSSFVIVSASDGMLWSSYGQNGIRVIDPKSGDIRILETPPINALAPSVSGSIWAGTESGLIRFSQAGRELVATTPPAQPPHQVLAVLSDGLGGVFYIDATGIRHRHADGRDTIVLTLHPTGAFRPLVMNLDHAGQLWLGGEGGLFRMRLRGDRVLVREQMDPAGVPINTVDSLMTDHRGWVWVGTNHGVSVFDGRRWVSVDASSGLAADDINQGGLREDPDGSVWIATSLGLSHLLHPERLFADPQIKVVIAEARIGSREISGRLPFSEQPLQVSFGTTSYAEERSIVFRYRLSGVDADWVTTSTGVVRYPFLPPGRHVLEVVGYDQLSRRSSDPILLTIDMAYPWWSQWWFRLACVLAAVSLIQGLVRLRLRLAYARQTELRRLVDEATAEMRAAQEQLRFQAQHDALTGLLTRNEIERRLASRLERHDAEREVAVALMDIDHFKAINDGCGHLGGDDVLRSIGMMVQGSLRAGDEAGRYGGEEMLIVLDDADGRSAERVLTLHRLIRGTSFSASGQSLRVTCSVGVAWARYGDAWETLIGRADDALYDAKHGGRDRVVEARQTSEVRDRRESDRRRPRS